MSRSDAEGTVAVRRAYLDALMARDSHRARAVVERALDGGLSPVDVDLEVLAPALHKFGELWAEGAVSTAHEHFATGISEGVMAMIAQRMRCPPAGGRLAVVACPSGERHSLAARMVADFLEAEGWEVLALGAETPTRDLLELVEDEQPDAVAVSVTMAANVPAAIEVVAALGVLEPTPLVVVGGQAWRGVAEVDTRADLVGLDLPDMVAALDERVPPRPDDD